MQKVVLGLLLVLILGRFLIVGKAKVLFNTHSSDGDEAAYLALGLALRETGKLTDGTRPPLYPLLLTPVAEREWRYFTWAKLITLGLGALTVLSTFLVGQRLFNTETGLLGAFLLAANREFHLRAATVYADTLLVALFVIAWYCLIQSFKKPGYRYLAGFMVGLTYLTKGSAGLLLVAWGLTALLTYRRQILRAYRELLPVPLIFLLTLSPLIIYNLNHFGHPFYNFATTHVMWMDRWSQSQVADPVDLPTLTSYLQTHTLADIAARLPAGISRLNPDLARTLIPSRTFEPGRLNVILLLGLLGLGVWSLLARSAWVRAGYHRYRLTIWLSGFLFLAYYGFSAWYAQVMMESRFLIPILGPFYLLLAAGLRGLIYGFRDWLVSRATTLHVRRWSQWGFKGLVALALMWGSWWSIRTTQTDLWSLDVSAFASDRAANAAPEAMLAWLERDYPPQRGPAKVIFGPSKSLPLWKFSPHFAFERIPVDVETWQGLQTHLAAVQPQYLIIDSDTARRRRQALQTHFSYHERGIEIQQMPTGWRPAYLSPGPPHLWSIFTPFTQPQRPLQAKFDPDLELVGYDLTLDQTARTLHAALYWRATAPLPEDYTIFLHLTAPDGFVKAQQDRRPFDGLWPTSSWLPGDIVADRFDIFLDDSLQPASYLLLTGLYLPASGQRLTLVAGPAAPSPNAALLGQIEVE